MTFQSSSSEAKPDAGKSERYSFKFSSAKQTSTNKNPDDKPSDVSNFNLETDILDVTGSDDGTGLSEDTQNAFLNDTGFSLDPDMPSAL